MSDYVNENKGLEDDLFDPGRTKVKVEKTKQLFNPSNYLNTRLGDNETSRTFNIRVILTPDNDGKYKVAIPTEVHNIVLNTKQQKAKLISNSKFKSFICLNDSHLMNDGGNAIVKCPFCEKKDEIIAEANKIIINENDNDEVKKAKALKKKAILKEGYSNESKIAYVVRCIERGKEEEGVKFWRFNQHDDKKGIFDTLYGFCKTYANRGVNIFDYENGYDIIVTLNKSSDGKTVINLMPDVLPSPLSTDENQKNLWLNDTKDWRDMYRAKSYDYLKIVADGETPVWDKDIKGWTIWKDVEELKNEENVIFQEAANELKDTTNLQKVIPSNNNNDIDEELPF